MARFALMPPLRDIPCVLDMVDVDSQKWTALAATSSGLRRWIYRREGRLLSAFEAEAAHRSGVTTVINAREQASLLNIAPAANVRVVSNGIDAAGFRPPAPAAPGARVVFVGVLDYRPNEEGALWMARNVWPAVRCRRPDARLVLVGANPTAAIRQLPSEDASIEVTGTVPDVRPHLWDAAVAVVPLATARGLQNKVLEAIAAGLPAVVTPVVREGLPPLVDPACIVAKEANDFADAIVSLLAIRPEERRVMAESVDLTSLSWSSQLARLSELIAALQIRVASPQSCRLVS
jgi:glycosyltransferase involved in cell wall biosynthesis